MYDNQVLKNYIRDKKYSKCISILKDKIVSFVIKQIQTKDTSVKFTTVSDLILTSDFYLNDSTIARSLQIALSQENELDKIEYLLLTCQTYNIR